MGIVAIADEDCPANLEDEDFDCCDDYKDLYGKIKAGTLTTAEIDQLIDDFITSNECGATLKIEFSKTEIDSRSLSKKATFYRLGWDLPYALAMYDEAEAKSMSWDSENYGWALYKWGAYHILAAGFTA